jgi:hypothetical protein
MVYNPLDLLVNDLVELTFDDEAGAYDVEQIIAYTTQRHGSTRHATRYFLQDVETEEENDPLVLEIAEPDQADSPVAFLFAITEAFEHDEEFVNLLDDDVFIISEEYEDEEEGENKEIEYIKISHVTSGTVTIDENNETNSGTVDVWTYQREEDGDTWSLAIEIDAEDGWTTFYEGYELAEGEWQVSRLSGDL